MDTVNLMRWAHITQMEDINYIPQRYSVFKLLIPACWCGESEWRTVCTPVDSRLRALWRRIQLVITPHEVCRHIYTDSILIHAASVIRTVCMFSVCVPMISL